MVTVAITNSYSKIAGLSMSQHKDLAKVLSYSTNPSAAYYSGAKFNSRRSLLSKKGEFPTGLLPHVESFLKSKQIEKATCDYRKRPTAYINYKPNYGSRVPYKAQLEAVASAKARSMGCISMPTGSGKSLVIAMLIAQFGVKTLIVVPNLGIKQQLIDDLDSIFGKTPNIVIENIDSKQLRVLTDFDCLIIDESHHTAAKTYQKLNKTAWTGIYHRFFLTATPFRNNKEETLLFESITGELIYSLSYKRAIAEGYIVPIEAYYIQLPKVKTDAYTWAEVYSELVVNNESRNETILALLASLAAAEKSTLCLVKEIKHGNNLAPFPFANGQDEDTPYLIQLFNQGKCKVLVGTTGVLGEGIDTKPCEYVIIAGLGKAKSAFMQQVGRAVRKHPGKESAKIILIKDPSHRYPLRHFKMQVKILKDEYGIDCTRLEL